MTKDEHWCTAELLCIKGELLLLENTPDAATAAEDHFRQALDWIGALDPRVKHPVTEGASDPQARLADMDAMGVDQTLLYPTWFAEGFFLMRDPDVAHALARAYNDWVADFCKAAPERLFAAAILPLQNMDFALEEFGLARNCPGGRSETGVPTGNTGRTLDNFCSTLDPGMAA